MRFAFKTSPQHTNWADMLDVWRATDDIELFESGWTFDHFYPIYGDTAGPCMEGWVTLTALAQATTRLRVSTLVTGIHYRHPAVLANMAATLDIISGGRLELGIGAGWNQQESGAYGIALGTPKDRSDRFEEACQILIEMLSPKETTSFSGRFYELQEARCNPKPLQQPLPICIGGNGERRTLRTAARFADHWNFVQGTVEEFSHKVEVLHQHCADLGRDPSEILLSSHVTFNGDAAATAATAAALGAAGAELAVIYLKPPLQASVLEPLAQALSDIG